LPHLEGSRDRRLAAAQSSMYVRSTGGESPASMSTFSAAVP
jgi:hypothetical protein